MSGDFRANDCFRRDVLVNSTKSVFKSGQQQELAEY